MISIPPSHAAFFFLFFFFLFFFFLFLYAWCLYSVVISFYLMCLTFMRHEGDLVRLWTASSVIELRHKVGQFGGVSKNGGDID